MTWKPKGDVEFDGDVGVAGTVTAAGLAPDAGPAVRNTYFLTAAPDGALGADGDIAIVVT